MLGFTPTVNPLWMPYLFFQAIRWSSPKAGNTSGSAAELRASLFEHLVVIGPAWLEAAARDFVHLHPPTAPCIAEYGQEFPAFLAEWPATSDLTYLPEFAALDWQLGRLSVCADEPALGASDLTSVGLERLPDAHVTLQEGLYLTGATWGVDELIQIYLPMPRRTNGICKKNACGSRRVAPEARCGSRD